MLSDLKHSGDSPLPVEHPPCAGRSESAECATSDGAIHAPRPAVRQVSPRHRLTILSALTLLLAAAAALIRMKTDERFATPKKPANAASDFAPIRLWADRVRGLPEAEQKKAIAARLKELNPDFDDENGIVFHFESSVLKSMSFRTDHVSDISFIAAFPTLEALSLQQRKQGGKLADLTPLRDLHLKELDLSNNVIADLTPLQGQPLESISLAGNPVHDLKPLRESPLKTLILWGTKIDDSSLRVLSGTKTLRALNIGGGTKVTDLFSD